jgi:hypothetical protein
MNRPRLSPAFLLGLCGLILAFAAAGCLSVRLIADYDQKMDEGVTTLQKKTAAFLVKLERTCQTPEGAYARHVAFYDEVRVDLSVLQVRAEAIAHNQLTCAQLKLLEDSFEKMEARHKLGFTPLLVAETRQPLNTTFTAILRLEVAKKRKP